MVFKVLRVSFVLLVGKRYSCAYLLNNHTRQSASRSIRATLEHIVIAMAVVHCLLLGTQHAQINYLLKQVEWQDK